MKFDDQSVCRVFKHEAFSMGQGGYNTTFQLKRDEVVSIGSSPKAAGLQDQPEIIEVLTDTSGEKEASPAVTNLVENCRPFATQAYMLFYVKVDESEAILRAPQIESIPAPIKTIFEEENQLVKEINAEHEYVIECRTALILTNEILQAVTEN